MLAKYRKHFSYNYKGEVPHAEISQKIHIITIMLNNEY